MRLIKGELDVPRLDNSLCVGEDHGRGETRCIRGEIRQFKLAGGIVVIPDHNFSVGPTGNEVCIRITLKFKPTVAHPT